MYKFVNFLFFLAVAAVPALAATQSESVVEGTVKKIDAGSKTMIVKTADGTEQTLHFADRVAVYGVEDTRSGSRETLRGLEEGSDVAVHYLSKGTEKTAEEIDRLGKDGLQIGDGTVKDMDRDAGTLTVKSADGAEVTYRLSERAARDAGMDLGKAGEKSENVTVYYTEEAGNKVAHFFKRVLVGE